MRRVLILQAGSADPEVRARRGDYPEWFARHLAPRVEVRVVRPYQERIPPLAPFHGVLMTGSPDSVTAPEPWMDDAAAYMLAAARTRPVLGVCFGHQLLARALGGRVERNPRGREAGTVEVHLTEAGTRDPLFAGTPRTLLVQETHADHVVELPSEAALLAGNDFSPVQAFGVGEGIRCVQFHPEMDAERARLVGETRRQIFDAEAPGGSVAVLASIRVTPEADRCLLNWLERFVGA
jgi:GMP synthase (glutamine-hydrolysing)